MTKFPTYRLCAAALAVVFCLFNVGLPVVIAACPMMGSHSALPECCASRQAHSGSGATLAASNDCCKRVVAAERNRTEFIGERHAHDVSFHIVAPDPASNLLPSLRQAPLHPLPAAAPSPPARDISTLTSALLI